MDVSGQIHATVTLSQAHLASCSKVTGLSSQGVNQPENETDLSHPYSLWLRMSEAVSPLPSTYFLERTDTALYATEQQQLRYIRNFFFKSNAPHVLDGLRGLPSWAWQKCNRLLRLGRP